MIVDYDGYLMMMMISSKTINDYTIGVYIYIYIYMGINDWISLQDSTTIWGDP